MKDGEKTWIVHDWEQDISGVLVRMVVRAADEEEALEVAYYAGFGEMGCSFENLEAEQASWLDRYEHLDDSDAAKEMRLHAQQACGKADGERQGLTMPIDTLAEAIDSTQCGMAASEDFTRSLDVSSMALVDIAVSLRALSGRDPVTDTPMQKRMREAIDKGEDPQRAASQYAFEYANAFKRVYKPRSATDPSPSADSTGKRQEDGKESQTGYNREES